MRRSLMIFDQYKGLSKSAYVIFFARMITSMGAFIWPMLTLILSRKLGYSAIEIAFISAIVGVVYLPATLLAGKLADRFNKKKLIILFDSISITLFIICGFLQPGTPMMLLFVIAGLFATMEGPAFEAIIIESSKPAEREKIYSLSYLGMNLGFMFGTAVGGILFENHLNIAFILDGTTTLISTLLIIIFVKAINITELDKTEINQYETSTKDSSSSIKVIFKRVSVLIQLIIFLFTGLIYSQWTYTLPLYIESLFGADGARFFGFLASFNGFVVIAMTPLFTLILRKFKELPKMALGVFLFAVSFLLIRNTELRYPFFIMMFFFTAGEVINMLGASPFLSRRMPSSHRGRISSFREITFFLGMTLGRIAVGKVIETRGFSTALLLITLTGILISIATIINLRIDKKIFPELYKKTI